MVRARALRSLFHETGERPSPPLELVCADTDLKESKDRAVTGLLSSESSSALISPRVEGP